MFRALPGGIEAVRNVTAALKERGVRTLVAELPWDQGTRRERDPETGEVLEDWDMLANLLEEIDGAGINGDTLPVMSLLFSVQTLAIGLFYGVCSVSASPVRLCD